MRRRAKENNAKCSSRGSLKVEVGRAAKGVSGRWPCSRGAGLDGVPLYFVTQNGPQVRRKLRRQSSERPVSGPRLWRLVIS